jgi:hypothetical protein
MDKDKSTHILVIYLQEILNELFHVIIEDSKLNYVIMYHKTVSINKNQGNIIYKINYPHKKKVSKNNIFINNIDIIYNLLNVNIFNKVFYGLNGEYKLNTDISKLFTIEDNICFINLYYTKLDILYYTNLVPTELNLIIISKLNKGYDIRALIESLIMPNILDEQHFFILLKLTEPVLLNDMLYLKNTFKDFNIMYKDLYIQLNNVPNLHELLYNNIRDNGTLIDENNFLPPDIISKSAENNPYKELLLSIRLKNVFPIWFTKLISFYPNLGFNIWMEIMKELYNIIVENIESYFKSHIYTGWFSRILYIKELIEGPMIPYSIPDMDYPNKDKLLLSSKYLLWYYLNHEGVSISNIELNFYNNKHLFFLILRNIDKIVPIEYYYGMVPTNILKDITKYYYYNYYNVNNVEDNIKKSVKEYEKNKR